MEKKKLKLSISGSSKKTLSSIEQAKSKSKNTVVIEKRNSKFSGKSQFPRQNNNFKSNNNISSKLNSFTRPSPQPSSDFEKRKLAEQRATRRIKGEVQKDNKSNKISGKRRELKLTISRALSDDHAEAKSRSLASLKRAKQKENRSLNQEENKDSFVQIKREVNLPEVITIKELANRMAEQSSSIIKHLLGMGVTVTINNTIDADTAEY
ncbi:translation initiation factor IF-2 N-terminal domain-containing protein, partial [Candidatus Pelagibacter sp.]|nr:translation initiation factor IF-2 N-terminal domain-containing protein [Candidatus Pelagibacter sp.]